MYKVKALTTFQGRNKRMIRKGKVFNTDDHYARLLINYRLVEVIAVINEKPKGVIKAVKEKAKEIYKKKIIEPEKNKEVKVEKLEIVERPASRGFMEEKEHEKTDEKMEGIKVELGETGILEESTEKKKKIISPITTDQFKTKKRIKKIVKRSKW